MIGYEVVQQLIKDNDYILYVYFQLSTVAAQKSQRVPGVRKKISLFCKQEKKLIVPIVWIQKVQ